MNVLSIKVFNHLSPVAALNACGLIPQMLNLDDPRPAREQLDTGYAHGGGWRPFEGFRLDKDTLNLLYPGDPPTRPIAKIEFRDEAIVVYEHEWVMILQQDGSHEIARMD